MRSREQLIAAFEAFSAGLGGGNPLVVTTEEAAEIRDALRDRSRWPRSVSEANTVLTEPPTIIPAQPGWRLAVLGPDEDLEACPIVAWTPGNTEPLTLEPIALYHSQDGLGAAALYSGRPNRIVGIIAPGDEVGRAWVDAGDVLAKALREEGSA